EAEKTTDCDVPESRVAVMVLEAVAPCTTDWSPPLLSERSEERRVGKEGKAKVVVRVRHTPVPVTVMVEGPVGVDVVVARVSVVVQVGLDVGGWLEARGLVGRSEAEKITDCDVPESRVAVMVLEAVAPCTTDWSPPLLSE